MLYYEFKKLFGKRKFIALLVLLSLITCFFTVVMCRITSYYDYGVLPFGEYLSIFWLYGMAILYIIIYINVSIFPVEEKNATSQILMTSQFGREQLAKAKILVALFTTNILVILFIVSSLFAYVVAFTLNFKITIVKEYEVIYATNSSVNTSGEVLLIIAIAFVFTANFTALLSMYLSAKLKNSYLVCILLFIGCFMALFSLNPIVGIFFTLMPLGNYIVTADGLKVMFLFGSFSVTLHSISLVTTLIFICILLVKIKIIYKTRK